MQKRLDEIGPVNLVAIEEYEETEQRHQFLTKQHDDLVNAKTQLLEVINRINSQTRQMFVETFEKIRDNFRAMFVEVFGGGKADLILLDENDVLESGIEIVARPPGKQLQSISLLSGGEQTMVAVSLLFSIYQVKPSPFCVLDELDAPLDEANVIRFVKILQRFLGHSQFVIITHNKRTIGDGGHSLRRDDAGARREQDRQREIPQGSRATGGDGTAGAGGSVVRERCRAAFDLECPKRRRGSAALPGLLPRIMHGVGHGAFLVGLDRNAELNRLGILFHEVIGLGGDFPVAPAVRDARPRGFPPACLSCGCAA